MAMKAASHATTAATHARPGTPTAGAESRRRGRVEAMGAIPRRSPVGHRAGELLGDRRRVGVASHDQARSRAYRWGEDGLLGICDHESGLCFSLALWNEADPILKERFFGLTGPQGNHGEDVKEYCFFLDNTPTHRA